MLANPGFTARDVPDQTGRTIVITGANNGLGLVTARALARAGARIVLACRNRSTALTVLEELRGCAPGVEHQLVALDLADLSSVQDAASQILDLTPQVDVLINNAGIMAVPFKVTVDGFESQIATNHFGHFALTAALLPALLAAKSARVVTLASIAHRQGTIDLTDINFERRDYKRMVAYSQSKLANLLFGAELARRSDAARVPLLSVMAHPGIAATNLFDSMVPRLPGALTATHAALRLIGNSETAGALGQLYAATMPDVENDDYLGPTQLNGTRGPVRRSPRTNRARDSSLAAALWDLSVDMSGADYNLLKNSIL